MKSSTTALKEVCVHTVSYTEEQSIHIIHNKVCIYDLFLTKSFFDLPFGDYLPQINPVLSLHLMLRLGTGTPGDFLIGSTPPA